MSILGHLLRPPAGARRAYSVFSKPGGGRYFNSAKPPKVAPPSGKGKVDTPSTTSSDAAASGPTKDESSSKHASVQMSAEGPSMGAPTPSSSAFAITSPQSPIHPTLILMISSSINFSPFTDHSSSFSSRRLPSSRPYHRFTFPPTNSAASSGLGNFEETPEASPEADADAARQLARAMVVNRLGASISWENTLKRLGLDVTEGRAEEVSLAQAEFEIYMDSTKRKRRRKMKKHKLKKRRRLNRAQRVKIGRHVSHARVHIRGTDLPMLIVILRDRPVSAKLYMYKAYRRWRLSSNSLYRCLMHSC
ncbi:hypothetical protein A0H81_10745 [Grifola frondosa]|uniref:Ribosomal protein mS38 C-terminal domain-containing protein n=1 Tax=Grifola frondosa TaxID=5627 RepID=A0A1C7LYH0_GRIFR|nr:hypothetical protein A0H81_10745 [Grifola frondosa]